MTSGPALSKREGRIVEFRGGAAGTNGASSAKQGDAPHRSRLRRRLVTVLGAGAIFLIGLAFGQSSSGTSAPAPVQPPASTATVTAPAATTTVTAPAAAATVTAPAVTTTVTAPTTTVTAPPITRTVTATVRAGNAPAAPRQEPQGPPAPDADPPPGAMSYPNCDAVRAAGKAPLYRGQPGYARHLDRDNDGIACERR